MADTVDIQWLYPPNWDYGSVPDDQRVGWHKAIVKLSGLSDGTGETDVTKVDISQMGNAIGKIIIF